VAATTVDTQCGSSQQATNLATSLIGSGVVDVAVACGVEIMSRIPIGINSLQEARPRRADPQDLLRQYEMTSQFEGAERIADKWGITRDDTDRFGLRRARSVRLGVGRGPLRRPVDPGGGTRRRRGGQPHRHHHTVCATRALRETSLEKLAQLKPVARERRRPHRRQLVADLRRRSGGAHDDRGEGRRARPHAPKARVVDTCLVGVDPVLMLTGPIDATQHLLAADRLTIDDIDTFEINEAFASVVLAWAKEVGADLEKTNPNGGAIALGHPLGGTGAFLLTKALYELERTGRPLRPDLDVLRRRPRHRHHHRAHLNDPASTLDDLRGRTLGFNDASSLSGLLALRWHLGADADSFFGCSIATGSHDASLSAVVAGDVDVASIDSNTLRLRRATGDPLALSVRILTALGPYPVQPVVVRGSLDVDVRARIRDAMLRLGSTDDERALLSVFGCTGFAVVTDTDYAALDHLV
jgi:acetyl-CoA C-acetyltransferase